jgi:hypothetical protein
VKGNPFVPPVVEGVEVFAGYKKNNPVPELQVLNDFNDIVLIFIGAGVHYLAILC